MYASAVILLLLLPFLLTVFISGKEVIRISETVDIEKLITRELFMEMPPGYEKEALKAQAVLVRSRICSGADIKEMQKAWKDFYTESQEIAYQEHLSEYQEAVKETKGEVLIYGGQTVDGPWHLASAGKTRYGKENFPEGTYLYLESVDSGEDIKYKNYLQGFSFSERKLQEIFPDENADFKKLKVEESDSAGYVKEVSAGEYRIAGETMRKKLGLSSSCFTIQILDDKIRFLCKGAGHGFGMSQFGAESMAKEGKNYREILKRYFPSVEIIAKD